MLDVKCERCILGTKHIHKINEDLTEYSFPEVLTRNLKSNPRQFACTCFVSTMHPTNLTSNDVSQWSLIK